MAAAARLCCCAFLLAQQVASLFFTPPPDTKHQPHEPGSWSQDAWQDATTLSAMPWSPVGLSQRTDSRAEVHELAGGRVVVLSDPWWVGNTHLKLVTVETRPNTTLIEGITNPGFGRLWPGYVGKLTIMNEWLGSQVHDGGLIIFADGSDVVFGGCSEEQFLRDYYDIVNRSNGIEVVIGAERGCSECPVTCDDLPKVPEWAFQDWELAAGGAVFDWCCELDPTGQMRFLNSGFFVGPVEKVSQLILNALIRMEGDHIEGESYKHNDQYYIYEEFLAHPNSVTLDYGSSLVTTLYSLKVHELFELVPPRDLYNRATGKRQCFAHAAGPSKDEIAGLVEWQRGGPAPW